MAKPRIVIVGAGFGGLAATKALAKADAEITLIDRQNHHLFQPLLYQVATAGLSPADIAWPVRHLLRRQQNTSVVLGEVVGVDLGPRRLAVETLGRRSEIPYDSLIIATGATQSYFGHPEFARHAPGMKTIDDALELRGRIFGAFEMAEGETDAEARRRWLTFVVVGAGPTGVELAGQLAELSRRELRRNFRRIDPAEARVILLGAAPTVLPPFPETLRERARRDLGSMGRGPCRVCSRTWTRRGSTDSPDHGCGVSMRRRRSGPPGCRALLSAASSPRRREPRSIERAE